MNSGKGTLTGAIRDPQNLLRALEAWNAAGAVPSRPARRPAPSPHAQEPPRQSRRTDDSNNERFANLRRSLPESVSFDKWDKKRGDLDLCHRFQVRACNRGDRCVHLHECAMPSCAGAKHAAIDCPKNK